VAPEREAESVKEPPTVIVDDRRVEVIVTTARLTVRGSHPLVALLLFKSPL
jgi:hypothetical protein